MAMHACNARASAGIVALRSALESLIRLAKQLTESTASGATSATTPTASARLRVRHEGRVILIDPRDVDWIESTGNYVHLHVRGSRFRHRATVDEMHALLGDGFVRIRRSTMVRIGAVKYCEPYGKGTYAIVLYDQTRLLSSRYFRKELRSLLGR